MAGIAFHPRHASQQHKGVPDYALARELVDALAVPVMLTGGLSSEEKAAGRRWSSGAEAMMLARGALGNPWLFEPRAGEREGLPIRRGGRRRAGLGDRSGEGNTTREERAARYLRKFYPWYPDRLACTKRARTRSSRTPKRPIASRTRRLRRSTPLAA